MICHQEGVSFPPPHWPSVHGLLVCLYLCTRWVWGWEAVCNNKGKDRGQEGIVVCREQSLQDSPIPLLNPSPACWTLRAPHPQPQACQAASSSFPPPPPLSHSCNLSLCVCPRDDPVCSSGMWLAWCPCLRVLSWGCQGSGSHLDG